MIINSLLLSSSTSAITRFYLLYYIIYTARIGPNVFLCNISFPSDENITIFPNLSPTIISNLSSPITFSHSI